MLFVALSSQVRTISVGNEWDTRKEAGRGKDFCGNP